MSVKVYGLDKVFTRLVKLNTALEPESAKAMRNVAKLIRDFAKLIVPVDTGALQTSIRLQVHAKPAKYILRVGVTAGGYAVNPKTGRKVDYASYVEYGTSRQFAQPFMRPALEQYKHLIPKKIRDGLHR